MAKVTGARWERPVREEYKLLSFQEVMELNGFEMSHDDPPPADIGAVKGAEPAVAVVDGKVTLVPTTFEWAESIDVARAEASRERAEKKLKEKNISQTEIRMAEARLKRALIRTSVASDK